MAIPAGWSAAEWAAYIGSAAEPCAIATRIGVTDLDDVEQLQVPASAFLEGQWDLVSGGEVDRTMRGSFVDIDSQLAPHFDPAVAPRRMLTVSQGTYVASLDKWLWVPTFNGRLHMVTDSGDGLWTVEAQDKSTFHNRGVSASRLTKGAFVVDAIRDYLRSVGETKFNIPSSRVVTTKLAADIKFGGDSNQMTPLAAMRKAASKAGCQLYWTGGGVATVRPWPTASAPLFTFDERLVMSLPEFSTDLTGLRNKWMGGGKGTLRASVLATGIYSPDALAVNGKPWANAAYGEDDESIGSKTELERIARIRILDTITLATTVRCSVVPFVAVDPSDVLVVATPDRTEKFTLRDCSVPIAGADSGSTGPVMTLGSHHNTRSGGAGRVRTSGRLPVKKRSKTKSKSGKPRMEWIGG